MGVPIARWVPSLTLITLLGCAGLDGDARSGASSEGLSIRIEMSGSSYAADQTPWVDVTYTNDTAEPMKLLTTSLPSEDLWEDLFTVRVDGAEVPYIGHAEHPEPSASDYLQLEPGQSIWGRVDLSRLYDLSSGGAYQIQIDAEAERFTGPDAAIGHAAVTIRSNRLAVQAEGRVEARRSSRAAGS